MSKGSYINVGNIEEDINELKILLFQDRLTNYGKRKLIDYYENKIARQKQINEEHQKINGELREKVKELDTKNDELLKDLYSANCIIADLIDSISTQKIKDKIEELKQDKENKYYDSFLEERDIEKTIDILQELLQESEEK